MQPHTIQAPGPVTVVCSKLEKPGVRHLLLLYWHPIKLNCPKVTTFNTTTGFDAALSVFLSTVCSFHTHYNECRRWDCRGITQWHMTYICVPLPRPDITGCWLKFWLLISYTVQSRTLVQMDSDNETSMVRYYWFLAYTIYQSRSLSTWMKSFSVFEVCIGFRSLYQFSKSVSVFEVCIGFWSRY